MEYCVLITIEFENLSTIVKSWENFSLQAYSAAYDMQKLMLTFFLINPVPNRKNIERKIYV